MYNIILTYGGNPHSTVGLLDLPMPIKAVLLLSTNLKKQLKDVETIHSSIMPHVKVSIIINYVLM